MVRDLWPGVKRSPTEDEERRTRAAAVRPSSFVLRRSSNKVSPKTGMMSSDAMLYLIKTIAHIQEGDVARMAKLFMITGAQTCGNTTVVVSDCAR